MTLGERANPGSASMTDLSVPFVLALVWSVEIALRFGAPFGVVRTLVASLGCAALTLGCVAMVARREGGAAAGFRRLVMGALLASGPLAIVGAALRDKTHHRALGGVTFSVIASALVVAGLLVAQRLLTARPGGARVGAARRWSLVALTIVSVAAALRPLLSQLGAAASATGRFVAEDVLIAAGLVTVLVALPNRPISRRVRRVAAVAWALSVVIGASLVVVSMPLRAMLSVRAPVALGVLGELGYAGVARGIPPAVDVSLH